MSCSLRSVLQSGKDHLQLKQWLTTVLQPLCDADPAALAKYVLALIKKEKPEKELRQSMIDQLDVFLQQETKGFVDLLFHTLATKSYVPNPALLTSTQESSEESSKLVTVDPPEGIKFEPVSNSSNTTSSDGTEAINNPAVNPSSVGLTPTSGSALSLTPPTPNNLFLGLTTSDSSSPSKVESKVFPATKRESSRRDDEKESRDSGRHNQKSRSPRRSPPRIHDRRIVRSRSPRDREQYQHRSRHRVRKSPRRYERDGWDRRRSDRRSPGRSNRSASPRTRSRTPTRYRRTYHSRSRSRSQNRDRSRSVPREKSDKKDTILLPPQTAMDEDMTNVEVPETKPHLQSVVRSVNHIVDKGEKVGYTTVTNASGSDRCRDFDEKGLCMRGELCPFDHGKDPVVLEDISVSPNAASGDYMGVGGPNNNMYAPQILRPTLPIINNPGMEPSMCWGNMPFRPRHMGAVRHRGPMPVGFGPMVPQRELINIPVCVDPMMGVDPMMRGGQLPAPPPQPPQLHPGMPGMQQHRGHMRIGGISRGGRGGRGGFDHGRLGSKPTRNFSNCSLEVKKIPRELNNIMDLNSHFLRFGKIVNIQINFENDPEAALITFSSALEANIAYRSTEAVLNNRFIRVFWHNKEKENEDGEAPNPAPEDTQQPRVSVKERLGMAEGAEVKLEQEKILVSGNNLTKTVYNPGLLAKKAEAASDKVQAVEAIKKSQEALSNMEQQKKVKEESQRNALKLMVDLRKRKQDMYEQQIEQQKKLITKLETCKGSNAKPGEKEGLMSLIKSLQESIETIKKDLDEASKPKATTLQLPKNKEDIRGLTQKEILDAELDLINKEQEGGDTNALQKKVYELRAQAQALGLIPRGGGGAGRSRAGYRGISRFSRGGRGRGLVSNTGKRFRQLRKVDRRTTTICVTGFPAGKLKETLAHFATFGAIVFYDPNPKVPSLTITYESRKKSEMAFTKGRVFDNTILDIQWVVKDAAGKDIKNTDGNKNGQASNQGLEEDNSGSLEDEEMSDIYADEILFQYEEDEDIDQDDRSWRR